MWTKPTQNAEVAEETKKTRTADEKAERPPRQQKAQSPSGEACHLKPGGDFLGGKMERRKEYEQRDKQLPDGMIPKLLPGKELEWATITERILKDFSRVTELRKLQMVPASVILTAYLFISGP